jgi:hypothetical protein
MNFDPKTRAWLILICTATVSGLTAATLAHAGGSTAGWTTISGVAGAATAVLHALMASPSDAATTNQNNKTP